jgi:hypothetical protein
VKREGLPASELGPQILPMQVWSPQDLSSLWKTLNTRTGAKKNCNGYFCHVCPCSSRDILFYKADENRCRRCKRNNSEKYFQWAVGDESTIEYFQTLLENEYGEFLRSCGTTLNDLKKKSKIKYNPTAFDKEVDVYNIEFAPSDAEVEKLFFFNTLVTEELSLRNMLIDGTLWERRE